ncbi:DUF3306 domain-containing protein (plasmid) [Azospirillum oryzae]|uniref:DUF3306 domain-containing protein n=1 Tax=Azospirillum oryzae TaxID=286727 RepID=A0A6N1AEA8_9PROT|nr:DUF3306 domain-containing protein [Azospirillum oryzae]KAA0584497.1 DUF3306 domain-containing protein [Azospirillum oryzae]QKS49820.1 DUF3306 domain-containing protein [Azospirillum oryzae]GLR79084.1 hypothetical protein GCM10007856_17580 [Azospirillum oryzae]
MTERMEEETGFLGRWSRLKREARTEQPVGEPAEPEAPALLPAETAEAEVVEEEAPKLPSLDSLDSGSDYTGFLRPDVPAELRRQALRKAWASDPVIAGFRGFAEYDWDYNAPGYGALRPTDDIARLLDAVLPDEKREEEVVGEEEVVAEVQADGATCPHLNPPPLGGGGDKCLSEEVAAVPPPPSGGG